MMASCASGEGVYQEMMSITDTLVEVGVSHQGRHGRLLVRLCLMLESEINNILQMDSIYINRLHLYSNFILIEHSKLSLQMNASDIYPHDVCAYKRTNTEFIPQLHMKAKV